MYITYPSQTSLMMAERGFFCRKPNKDVNKTRLYFLELNKHLVECQT